MSSLSVRIAGMSLGVGIFCAVAEAGVVDLSGGSGSGTINGAIFEFGTQRAAGTGNIDSFLRVQASPTERGYNTSARPVAFDELTAIFVHDIRLYEIPIVARASVDYYEFLLDLGEGAGPNSLISLDQVKIYTSATNFTDGNNPSDPDLLGTLRYNMDAGADSYVKLDAVWASGNGETDMTMLVPVSFFSGALPGHYVYLYSVFGENFESDAGFEEWAVAAVPEPASLSLLALGGLAVAAVSRRRRRQRRA